MVRRHIALKDLSVPAHRAFQEWLGRTRVARGPCGPRGAGGTAGAVAAIPTRVMDDLIPARDPRRAQGPHPALPGPRHRHRVPLAHDDRAGPREETRAHAERSARAGSRRLTRRQYMADEHLLLSVHAASPDVAAPGSAQRQRPSHNLDGRRGRARGGGAGRRHPPSARALRRCSSAAARRGQRGRGAAAVAARSIPTIAALHGRRHRGRLSWPCMWSAWPPSPPASACPWRVSACDRPGPVVETRPRSHAPAAVHRPAYRPRGAPTRSAWWHQVVAAADSRRRCRRSCCASRERAALLAGIKAITCALHLGV